jgi:hypothetical protein
LVNVTGSQSYTYTGSGQGPATATVSGSSGAVTYSYSGTGSTTYAASALPPTNAGSYQVIASVAADSHHGSATSAAYTFSINKASLTITAELKNKGQPRSGETGMFFMPPRRDRAGRFAGGWRGNAVRRQTARHPESP